MAITIASWCLVTWIALCEGIFFKKVWSYCTGKKEQLDIDLIMMLGLCVTTVYSQIYSLFAGVKQEAAIAIFILSVLQGFLFRKEIIEVWWFVKKLSKEQWGCTISIFLIMLMLSLLPREIVDTSLYHAQTVRYIEEVGVIKGLGLLHCRLAYNSSFLALQALFGLKWLFGMELHSLNAYIGAFLGAWAICTLSIWKKEVFKISDAYKLVFIFNLCVNRKIINSPSTDFFAISLVLYIFTKWIELFEKKEKRIEPYIVLCFLSVYAVTLKISSAMVVLLAFYPMMVLIKEKRWKLCSKAVVIGLLIVAPFLIRNILISGYLLYPMPEIDLFSVDWKIPLDWVIYDKKEITVWGRALYSVDKYEWGVSQWFPIWWEELYFIWKGIFILFLFSILISVICLGKWICLKKKSAMLPQMVALHISMWAFIFMWFFTAPSPRFGGISLLWLPAWTGGYILKRISNKRRQIGKVLTGCAIVVCVGWLCMYIKDIEVKWICPNPYVEYEVEKMELDGVTFYRPIEGMQQTGYESFPQFVQHGRSEQLELREYGNLKKGIKVK